ncbi:hypothetical protein B0H16DRAFT_1837469 [Mycena metata]|uniref:Uncharacterized protein n=1 Tax=Mycena metata TaxID=1033252 RepID=A0AAD7NAB5_9AGAR|nr:hypothetical protein B0H16DRAFT_1837469 [Mycena metata]
MCWPFWEVSELMKTSRRVAVSGFREPLEYPPTLAKAATQETPSNHRYTRIRRPWTPSVLNGSSVDNVKLCVLGGTVETARKTLRARFDQALQKRFDNYRNVGKVLNLEAFSKRRSTSRGASRASELLQKNASALMYISDAESSMKRSEAFLKRFSKLDGQGKSRFAHAFDAKLIPEALLKRVEKRLRSAVEASTLTVTIEAFVLTAHVSEEDHPYDWLMLWLWLSRRAFPPSPSPYAPYPTSNSFSSSLPSPPRTLPWINSPNGMLPQIRNHNAHRACLVRVRWEDDPALNGWAAQMGRGRGTGGNRRLVPAAERRIFSDAGCGCVRRGAIPAGVATMGRDVPAGRTYLWIRVDADAPRPRGAASAYASFLVREGGGRPLGGLTAQFLPCELRVRSRPPNTAGKDPGTQ